MMLNIFHRLFGHLYAAAMTGALSAAERSYTKSEVRGRSQENPMPKGRRPRGVTPRPRSGAAADSARLQQHRNGWEDLPCMWGQGGRSRGVIPCPGQRRHREDYSASRSELAAGRSYPTPPYPHARGQGQRLGGPTRHPRSRGCTGTGGPRGAIPRWRSGRAAVRRYPTPKVRETQVRW